MLEDEDGSWGVSCVHTPTHAHTHAHAHTRTHTHSLTLTHPSVQSALTDADPGVREAAGEAFSIMFKGGAGGAVDSVVPQLMEGGWQGGEGWCQVQDGLGRVWKGSGGVG